VSLLALAVSWFRRRLLLSMSALAIALGVAVMFAVLAVMNGFLYEFERTIREFAGDVVVRPLRTGDRTARPLEDYLAALEGIEGVVSVEPRLNWFGLVGRRGARALDDPRSADLSGLLLVGVDDPPAAPQGFGDDPPLWPGRAVADRLQLAPGERLEVISYAAGDDGQPFPVRGTFTVGAAFATGQFDQDLDRALVPRAALARFARSHTGFSDVMLRAGPGADVPELAARVRERLERNGLMLPGETAVLTWRDQGGNFLAAVENQRGILSMVFFFIVLVAAYQLVATLLLTVAEKRHDLGVLGALGAAPARIAGFFVALGLFIAGAGTAAGLLLGWWLSHNLDVVEGWIGGDEPIFRADIYKFETIPIAIDPASLGVLVGATLAAAALFSFLPAWRGARTPLIRALQSR